MNICYVFVKSHSVIVVGDVQYELHYVGCCDIFLVCCE